MFQNQNIGKLNNLIVIASNQFKGLKQGIQNRIWPLECLRGEP
jgi:hypothetical protein